MSGQHITKSTQHCSATSNDHHTQQRLPHYQHRTHHRKLLPHDGDSSSSIQQHDTTDDVNQQQHSSDDVSVDLPTPPPSPVGAPQHLSSFSRSAEYNSRILTAKRSGNLRAVMVELGSMKKQRIPLTHHTYNVVLDAHATLRREGTPLNHILKLYDEMRRGGITPTNYTYTVLIRVLCRRDVEVQKTIAMLKRQAARTGVVRVVDEDVRLLEMEHNIEKALAIFREAAEHHVDQDFDVELYNQLLRVLSHYGNMLDGRFIYNQLVHSPTTGPNSATFAALINLMGRAGDIESALRFFCEYKSVRFDLPQHDASYVYNALVDAYLKCNQLSKALQVLQHDMVADNINVTIIPYNSIIRHYCAHDKIEDACQVVDSLMRSDDQNMLPKPDASSYGPILAAYCQAGKWQPASKVYTQLLTTDIGKAYGNLANYALLCLSSGHGDDALNVVNDMRHAGLEPDPILADRIISFFVNNSTVMKAIHALDIVLSAISSSRTLGKSVDMLINTSIISDHVTHAMHMARLAHAMLKELSLSGPATVNVNAALVDAWKRIRQQSPASALNDDNNDDLIMLCEAVIEYHFDDNHQQQQALEALVHDVASTHFRPPMTLFKRILGRLRQHDLKASESEWKALSNEVDAMSIELARAATRGDWNEACQILEHKFIKSGLTPTAESVRDAVTAAGKHDNVDMATKIYELYNGDNRVANKANGQQDIYLVLNALLIVYAQHGEMMRAKECYDTIKTMGRVPDSNAYASLLLGSARCATDEATDALAIYDEAKRHGVQPTTFFYNVIISKFAKARKLEPALRLFEEMQELQVAPNCITYGAVLSACVRAGSESHARRIFGEMLSAPSYQPRVGPFNNMIQFYVRQERNRTRALEYVSEMFKRRIRPSAHTYKLMIEMYANITPTDMVTAHSMLTEMERRHGIRPEPTHYATLIYSYGILQRDVRSAEQVFETMHVQPDEVVFQALLDTLISNGHIDRAEKLYYHMLQTIHKSPSPYIENLFIRGYGQQGNLAKAEHIFSTMTDDKLLRSSSSFSTTSSSSEDQQSTTIVVREPSTYETMVRAYIDNGRIDKAKDILDMMAKRDFPSKVLATVADLVLE
ncbi:hypothetical protein K492DRAFT_226523 [Lichtheimia hyalospora FSU 10163]|nr:hypothetical protein K492DRAFT_226523 [Lichtheimia hyalospora FSU 10163]